MRSTRTNFLIPFAVWFSLSVAQVACGDYTLTRLGSFTGANGLYPAAGLTMDAQGNLYGTTANGGISGGGTVFEVAVTTHALTTLANFNIAIGEHPTNGLAVDAQSNLYGTTSQAGPNGFGSAFKIAAGSHTLTTLANFSANLFPSVPDRGYVVVDAQGNLYGTTLGGPSGGGTVYEIAAGSHTLTTLATFNGANGSGPSGLTLDAQGNL